MALLSGCAAAERPAARPVPEAAAETPVAPPPRSIVVRKLQRTLTLYEGDRILKVYPVVLGKDPFWAKLHQGDHRTPEGDYHISAKYLHPFWSRFMLIDYPTPANQEIYAWSRAHGLLPERGRALPGIGGAIGIHGTEDESLNQQGVDWTEGCVSLFNHDIDELYDLVPVGTPVRIER